MTKTEFMVECGKRLIDVDVALDNASIQNALMERNDEGVIDALNSEF